MCLALILCLPSEAAKQKATSGRQPKYSAIVMDADTGEVLESENPNGIRHPASLTKMMTLYLLFEELKKRRLSIATRMSASAYASRQSPSKLGLLPGDMITVAEAIQALVTKSANDVAVVVAEHLAGSEQAFARRMTQKARALGMRHTTFKNASGLPNPAQVTTAYDMAKLSQALYQDFPQYYRYFKQKHYNHKGAVHQNHNHLLGKVSGVDGIKTGYIAASGFNLAASAVRYDAAHIPHRLIAVVLGGPNRHWRDRQVENLLEMNFQRLGITEGKRGWIETKYIPSKDLENMEEGDDPSDEIGEILTTLEARVSEASNSRSDKNQAVMKKIKTVQIGSYKTLGSAKQAWRGFQKFAGEGKLKMVVSGKGKKKLYGVQVQRLSTSSATRACQKWRLKGNECTFK